MNSLDKVKSIIAYLQTTNLEVITDHGLSETEILDAFKNINLLPPPEIIELYQWHNGIGELDCFLRFMNLDDAIMWYELFRDCYRENNNYYYGGQENWFPMLNMNGDVQLCLDFKTLSVISIDIECDIVEEIANHYTNYLDALLYVFNKESFEYDDDSGCIKFNEEVWEYARNLYQIKHPWLQGD
ncbi:MAG: SMI1/KNR4 family protein [Cyanobacteria bacterium P01_A01_bin.83]